MKISGIICLSAAFLLGNLIVVDVAQAQEDQRGVSVMERARPDYDPRGLHMGSFFIYPSLTLSTDYNDNIFTTDGGETDDFIYNINPEVLVQSDWVRHELTARAYGSFNLHQDETGEDFNDYGASLGGRADLTRNTNIVASASYDMLNENRGANTVGGAAKPTEYDSIKASVGINQHFNRLTASIEGAYENLDYDDVDLIGGGTTDNDFRDRDIWTGLVQFGYDVSPDTLVYVRGEYNVRDYDQKPATPRDSEGYSVVIGSEFKLSRLVSGDVFVGYQEQDYDALNTVEGVAYGLDVDWYVTPLTTVRISGQSVIAESIVTGASGILKRGVSLGVDHELMRNVFISGDAEYRNEDYEGIAREDDFLTGGLKVNYLINRNLSVALGYDITNRDSNTAGNDYTQNDIGLSLRAQF